MSVSISLWCAESLEPESSDDEHPNDEQGCRVDALIHAWASNEDCLERMLEDEIRFQPLPDYLSSIQDDVVKDWMRSELVEWMMEVCEQYKLSCLSLAVNCMDRFLSVQPISPYHLQCVGAAALLICAKLKDSCWPSIDQLCICASDAFDSEDLRLMEQMVLTQLCWQLGAVSAEEIMWLLTLQLPLEVPTLVMLRRHARLLIDMCHLEYSFLQFRPSAVAAAAILCALDLMSLPVSPLVLPALRASASIDLRAVDSCCVRMQRVFRDTLGPDSRDPADFADFACAERHLMSPCIDLAPDFPVFGY